MREKEYYIDLTDEIFMIVAELYEINRHPLNEVLEEIDDNAAIARAIIQEMYS